MAQWVRALAGQASGPEFKSPRAHIESWMWSLSVEVWKQEDHWDLLASSLVSGLVRESVSRKIKMEPDKAGHSTSSGFWEYMHI